MTTILRTAKHIISAKTSSLSFSAANSIIISFVIKLRAVEETVKEVSLNSISIRHIESDTPCSIISIKEYQKGSFSL